MNSNGNGHSNLVAKVWNYAHVLRDQGVACGDYLEQITFLLFLKMDDERENLLKQESLIPKGWRWKNLRGKDGDDLELQYRHTLEALTKESGIIGVIYRKAQNKIGDPAKLKRLVSMIDDETWLALGSDVKGEIYEGLLQRNAQEVKSGAGQYFTPRPLIGAMVEVMRPTPETTVCDPACGTGGFLLSTYEFMMKQTNDKAALKKLKASKISGVDLVDEVVRLCAMNLYLHDIGGVDSVVHSGDSLAADPGKRFDMVLTNPPFGKKSSYTVVGNDGAVTTERETYERNDFKVSTSNKQLNFLQHIMTILDTSGRAAVVLPDNVLFEGGAGERLRKRLLEQFDFHTMIRLPTGIWYSPSVKANVLFFDKKLASKKPWTKELWIYDFRINQHFTLKTKQLTRGHLDEFVACYNSDNRHKRKETERFKKFTYDELIKRDKLNLDIFWLKDDNLEDPDNLPPPDVVAAEIIENLEAALEQFRGVAEELGEVPVE